jgi:FkbM family methyltransferase
MPLVLLRAWKLFFSLCHPQCWNGLLLGVAPSVEHRRVLEQIDGDLIIDVGANRGQFSLVSRVVKPKIPIVAFEPIPAEATIYRQALAGMSVQLNEVALGEQMGEAPLHLSRSADSSSLLPIGEPQRKLFPKTDEVGTLRVPVRRLDDYGAQWVGNSRIFLKIDVQGYELSVLRGAVETLSRCAYVYVECSEDELYVGQALFLDVEKFLAHCGFRLQSRHNDTIVSGRLVQADYLFVASSRC